MTDDFNLTPHFKFSELAGTSHEKYRLLNLDEAQKQMGKMYMLAGFAERVREIIGKPVIITSGFRCKELNKAIGGAITSQHTLCEAIDIVVKGMRCEDVFNRIVTSDLKYNQIIIERNKSGSQWVHISIGSYKQKLQFDGKQYIRLD